MAAQTFSEWFDIVTDVGDQDPFSGFTSKGIAHLGWDAAIKSLEGVQNQTNNSAMDVIGALNDCIRACNDNCLRGVSEQLERVRDTVRQLRQ